MINPNEPAFPMLETDNPGHRFGMTVRCELAKAAMQGLLANPNTDTDNYDGLALCQDAVHMADYMIAALNAADTKGEK